MSDINRDNLDEQLSAYLDGELSDLERAEVERTISADPDARAMLDTLRRTTELVQHLPRRKAPDTLIDDLTARIEREQLLGGPEIATRVATTRRSIWPMLARAAVMVFAVGAGFWAFREIAPSGYESGPTVASRSDERKERVVEPEPFGRSSPAAAPRSESADVRLDQTEAKAERARAPVGQVPSAVADQKLGEKPHAPAVPVPAVADISARDNAAQPAAEGLGRDAVASAKPPEVLELGALRQAGIAGGWDRGAADDALLLNLSFQNEADRVQCREELTQFFAANRIEPAPVDLAVAPNLMGANQSVAGQAPMTAGAKLAGAELLLVEMPASQVGELVDKLAAPAAGQRGIELEIGQYVVASGAERVREVLNSRWDKDRNAKEQAHATADELASAVEFQYDDARSYGLAFADRARAATIPAEESADTGSRGTATGAAQSMRKLSQRSHRTDADTPVTDREAERDGAVGPPVVTEGTAESSAAWRVESRRSDVRAKAESAGNFLRGAAADEGVVKLLINFLAPSEVALVTPTSRPASDPAAESRPAASQPEPVP